MSVIKSPTLQPLPVWKSKESLWLLLIPYLKSLYSTKWSLGCYAIENVSLKPYVTSPGGVSLLTRSTLVQLTIIGVLEWTHCYMTKTLIYCIAICVNEILFSRLYSSHSHMILSDTLYLYCIIITFCARIFFSTDLWHSWTSWMLFISKRDWNIKHNLV